MIVRGTYQSIDFYYIFQYTPVIDNPVGATYRGGYPALINPLWWQEWLIHYEDSFGTDEKILDDPELYELDLTDEENDDDEEETFFFWEDYEEWDTDEFEDEEEAYFLFPETFSYYLSASTTHIVPEFSWIDFVANYIQEFRLWFWQYWYTSLFIHIFIAPPPAIVPLSFYLKIRKFQRIRLFGTNNPEFKKLGDPDAYPNPI